MCRSDIGGAAAAAAPAAPTAAQAAAKAAPRARAAAVVTEVEWACSDAGVSLDCGPFTDCSVAFLATGATAAGACASPREIRTGHPSVPAAGPA